MFSSTMKLHLSQLYRIHVFRNLCKKATKGKLSDTKPAITKTFGQPTPETHPHLLSKGEITPLIQRSEYEERRQRLMETISTYVAAQKPSVKHHLIVIPSASKQYMSDKIPYFFRQNTDFMYLTGCLEPDSCLVMTISDSDKFCSTLFMREKNDHSELWDGPRTGPEAAPSVFGIDDSLPAEELENYVQSFFKSNRPFSLWYDYTTSIQMNVHRIMRDYLNDVKHELWESPKGLIHRQRVIKSPAEIALMQKSCDIASDAIIAAIEDSKPGVNEHEIFAKVDYECRMNGAEYLAYPPVVAGGNRANTIHYINNNQVVKDREMVLMDAGCEYHGYSSDITRTWPVNGKFTTEQRVLYEIVLKCQRQLINECANLPSLDSVFDSMCLSLGKDLQEACIISKSLTTNQQLMKAAYQFCPHHVSHYLGMDVHDTPIVTRNINIEPGMIVTIEPGIYINEKCKTVPKEFRGLGIRIEDDVLVTDNEPVILSRRCPKSVEDVEEIASRNQ